MIKRGRILFRTESHFTHMVFRSLLLYRIVSAPRRSYIMLIIILMTAVEKKKDYCHGKDIQGALNPKSLRCSALHSLPSLPFLPILSPQIWIPHRPSQHGTRTWPLAGTANARIKCIGNYVYPPVFVEVKYFLSRSIPAGRGLRQRRSVRRFYSWERKFR